MKSTVWLGTLLISCLNLLSGQTPWFRYHPIEETVGNAQAELLYECKNGFIWLGTPQGLLRYDGVEYQPFLHPDSSTTQQVTAIGGNEDFQLWVGYENGFLFQLDLNGEFSHLKQLHAPIRQIRSDGRQGMWIATYGEGLYHLQKDSLRHLDLSEWNISNDIYSLSVSKTGEAWIGTDNGLIRCRKAGELEVAAVIREKDGLPDNIVHTTLIDEQDRIWVGTHDGGFGCYDPVKQSFLFLPEKWTHGSIVSLELFEEFELWIGTSGNGVFRYDLQSGYLHGLKGNTAPEGRKVYDLHIDREGNIWVLNNREGLSSANRRFELYPEKVENIQALLSDQRGRLWIGTQQGLYVIDSIGQPVRKLAALDLNIVSLFEDPKGLIWAGSFGEGLFCFDPATGHFRHFGASEGLLNQNVLSIDGIDNKLWLATLGGLFEVELHGKSHATMQPLFRHFDQEEGLVTNFIYKIYVDSRARVWFAMDGEGISYLQDGKVVNFPAIDSLPLKTVYSITEDQRGHIWISTSENGIFEIDDATFYPLSVKEGIRDLAITSLITDKKGNILIVHPSGIDILDPETRHLIYYGKEIGIDGFDPNINAVCKDKSGNIWIASQNQLFRYPSLREDWSIHPRTHIQAVSASLKPVDHYHKTEFGYRDNFLVFEYVGLWYTAPEKVVYRYKLEGFDHDWIYSRDRRANYSNLPPGDYSFMLTSTENEAFDQEEVVSYDFTILRPVWMKAWFWLLIFAVLGLFIRWVWRTKEARMRKEELLKKERVQSQYETLKAQINPHFLFNNFNTLSSIIEEDPKLAVEYLEHLADFYRSILVFREKELIDIKQEMEVVGSYGFLLNKRYGQNLQLCLDIPEDMQGKVAPLTLQMLIENAVKHNVIAKTAPLKVRISLTEDQYIRVCNNRQPKLTKEKSTGFGLQSIVNNYSVLTDRRVRIKEDADRFEVQIPLILDL